MKLILHADNYESFLQIDTTIFDGDVQAFPEFPKLQVCNTFTVSQKKVSNIAWR